MRGGNGFQIAFISIRISSPAIGVVNRAAAVVTCAAQRAIGTVGHRQLLAELATHPFKLAGAIVVAGERDVVAVRDRRDLAGGVRVAERPERPSALVGEGEGEGVAHEAAFTEHSIAAEGSVGLAIENVTAAATVADLQAGRVGSSGGGDRLDGDVITTLPMRTRRAAAADAHGRLGAISVDQLKRRTGGGLQRECAELERNLAGKAGGSGRNRARAHFALHEIRVLVASAQRRHFAGVLVFGEIRVVLQLGGTHVRFHLVVVVPSFAQPKTDQRGLGIGRAITIVVCAGHQV